MLLCYQPATEKVRIVGLSMLDGLATKEVPMCQSDADLCGALIRQGNVARATERGEVYFGDLDSLVKGGKL